jgi:hypothetical protein
MEQEQGAMVQQVKPQCATAPPGLSTNASV